MERAPPTLGAAALRRALWEPQDGASPTVERLLSQPSQHTVPAHFVACGVHRTAVAVEGTSLSGDDAAYNVL
eukprot:4609747-Prymnesium_polylepis.1